MSGLPDGWPERLPPGVRGVFHGAMALWLTRYLNQPPARLPGERGQSLDDLPSDPEELSRQLLEAFDRQQQVSPSARLVARWLGLGHPPERLIATLAHGLLRKDADFHTYQMFEAGVRQHGEWGPTLAVFQVSVDRRSDGAANRWLTAVHRKM